MKVGGKRKLTIPVKLAYDHQIDNKFSLDYIHSMTKKQMEELGKMMIQVFNDGYEKLIMPRFEEIDENMHRMKKELKQEFKAGQQSLSNRLEVIERKMDKVENRMGSVENRMGSMEGKMDQVITENKNSGERLDKVERIIKSN